MPFGADRRIVEEFKAAMLQAMQQFFDGHASPGGASAGVAMERPLKLATAALLVGITRADFDIKPEEWRAVTRALVRVLNCSPEDITALVRDAENELDLAVPLRDFIRLIDERFSLEQKKQVIELLWRVAFADAEILPAEEYLVRKISNQLHLPLADFLDAKIKARDGFELDES